MSTKIKTAGQGKAAEETKANDPAEDFKDPKVDAAKAAKAAKEAKDAEIKAAKEAEQEKIKAAQGDSSYVAKVGERHLYHVKLDKPSFDSKTGKKLSKAYIQKFGVQAFKNHKRHEKALGFTSEVLWDPEAYAKA